MVNNVVSIEKMKALWHSEVHDEQKWAVNMAKSDDLILSLCLLLMKLCVRMGMLGLLEEESSSCVAMGISWEFEKKNGGSWEFEKNGGASL
ncbi:unnamed protein product [Arabidopsis thaliana]|uniref:Uncharacterized protein n=1 Tax=Arabidopsis thaliana TaxID=3702 RepID=A0A654FZC2_ARATH|nr:unnamed protein product [Arabidopsis thaliana]